MSLVGGAFFTKSFGHNCILTSKKILSNFCQKNFGTIWSLPHETQTVERPKKWNNPLWVDFDFFMTHLMRVFCLKRLSLPQREELLKSLSLSISGWEMNRGLWRTRKTLLSMTTVGRQTFAEKIFGLSLLVANVWLRLSIESSFEQFYENFCSYPAGF